MTASGTNPAGERGGGVTDFGSDTSEQAACRDAAAISIESLMRDPAPRTCACGVSISAANKSGVCRGCRFKAMRADPAAEAKRAEAFRRRMADPEFRAKHVAASAARLKEWRKRPEGQAYLSAHGKVMAAIVNGPDRKAARIEKAKATRHAWCPAPYRALNQELRKAKVTLLERKVMIAAQVKADKAKRLAAMTPLERQLERVRNGATVTERVPMRRADHDFTLGGVATGML